MTQIALQCKGQALDKWFLKLKETILNQIIGLCQYAVTL